METKPTYVSISLKEYTELLEGARWLAALEAAGVDNWEGISEAHDIMQEEDEG